MIFCLKDLGSNRMVNLKSGDVIGRGECTHSFKDGIKLSRTHCKFSIDDGEIFITDLNSTNGTLLNQKSVTYVSRMDHLTFEHQ
jgi:pSer/pThr/pTyr-binding forkhead associated (FHA) protein